MVMEKKSDLEKALGFDELKDQLRRFGDGGKVMTRQPNWTRLERERQQSSQELYDSGVNATVDKPKPCYAPCYAAMYPELATIAREHGYALAIHGSMRRDFDLIAVPWTPEAAEPLTVIDAFLEKFSIHLINREPLRKEHGRLAWTVTVGWGECALDLSFMPRAVKLIAADAAREG